jgi:hypothetical protein
MEEQSLKNLDNGHGGHREGSGRKTKAGKLDELSKEGQKRVYSIMEADFWVKMANDHAAPRLERILTSGESKDENVIAAAKEVLNRALGKSKESVHMTGDVTFITKKHYRANKPS